MFELLFGTVWLLITSVCLIPFFMDVFSTNTPKEVMMFKLLMIIPFAILFFGIGFWALAKGIKKVVKNSKTDKYGIQTFGKILHIKTTGNSVNGIPELAAEIATYIPDMNTFMVITESIGFGITKYEVGSYVALKFFEDDINVIDSMDPINISSALREKMDRDFPLEDTNPKIMMIDGIKYIRSDLVDNKTSLD